MVKRSVKLPTLAAIADILHRKRNSCLIGAL